MSGGLRSYGTGSSGVPNAYAIWQADSTDQGALFPRQTTAQRTTLGGLLGSGDKGMLVYDTDLLAFYAWSGAAWVAVGSGSIPASFTNVTVTGTAGSGYLKLPEQSATPTFAANNVLHYVDSSNRPAWIGENNKTVTLDATANAADAVYTLPSATDTLIGSAAAQSMTNKLAIGMNVVTALAPGAIASSIANLYGAIQFDFAPASFVNGTAGLNLGMEATDNSNLTVSLRGMNYCIQLSGSGGASTGNVVGVQGDARNNQSAGTVFAVTGYSSDVRNVNASVITTANGFNTIMIVSGTGAITTAYDYRVRTPTLTGSGGIGNHVGFQIDNLGSAKETTSYGIYINTQTGATGGSWAIYTNGGAVRFGDVTSITVTDAVTNAVSQAFSIGHDSSGTPAAGFGESTGYYLHSSTTVDTLAGLREVLWNVATHASRASDMRDSVYYTTTKQTFIEAIAASGGVQIGLFGVTPVAKASAPTAALTTITFTSPGTPDYAIATVQLAGYGFSTQDEGNTVLSVIANLQARVNQLATALANIGITA